jgi:hypothetical protein
MAFHLPVNADYIIRNSAYDVFGFCGNVYDMMNNKEGRRIP